MNNKEFTILATAIFTMIMIIIAINFHWLPVGEYQKTATVVADYNGWLVLETEDGHLWEAGDDDFKMGNKVVITFYDNDTPSMLDDEIIEIRLADS